MSGLNIKLADLQMSDFHAPECCFFCDDILKKPSASGGVAPRPLPGALPLDPTGGVLRPPDPRYRLVDLVVKASASRAEGPGFESRLRRDFFGVESWHSSGYPARRLAL